MPKITNLSVRGDSPQPESSSVKEEIQGLSLFLDFSKYEVKRYFGGKKLLLQRGYSALRNTITSIRNIITSVKVGICVRNLYQC